MKFLRYKPINLGICIIMVVSFMPSYAIANTFDDKDTNSNVADAVAESLVTAQSIQSITLGDKISHDFTDLMVVEDGITYLPVRLAFTGDRKGSEHEAHIIDKNGIDIRTSVLEFMQEPTITIASHFTKPDGTEVHRMVNINYFTDQRLEELGQPGIGYDYRGYGIVNDVFDDAGNPIAPYGQLIFRKKNHDVDEEKWEPVIWEQINSWHKPLKAMPKEIEIDSEGYKRVYISIDDFNTIVQYLVGDTTYHVEKP